MAQARRPWTALRARWSSFAWSLAGLWSLSRGRLPQALTSFEHAAAARPDAFRPLLRLAHGYLLARDVWRAHRTLARARENDPIRFARVVPSWLDRVGVAGETRRQLLGTAVTRTDWGPRIASPAGVRERAARRVEPGSLPLGDCMDLDEYARFRAMPPISEGERESVDWDALLEDLLE